MAKLDTRVDCTVSVDRKELRHTVSSVVLTQHIDRHHELRVGVKQGGTSAGKEEFVDQKTFRSFLGKSISVRIEPQGGMVDASRTLEFVGVVTRVGLDNSVDGLNEVSIIAHSPTLALDGARRNSILFEQKASDVIKGVLQQHQITLGSIEATSRSVPYCVQYGETDYQFVSRLATANGLFAFYDGQQFCAMKASSSNTEELKWRQDLGVFSLGLGTASQDHESAVWDEVNKEVISSSFDGSPSGAAPGDLSRVSLEASNSIYKPMSFVAAHKAADMASLDDTLKRSKDAAVGRMIKCNGESIVPAVKVGGCVQVSGMGGFDGQYYVTGVKHHVEESGQYHNEFECTPLDMAYPSPRHALPPVTDIQSAVVVDVNDPDKRARVKVKFPWKDGETSAWVRMSQPYAGAERGWYAMPEVDDEVLVAFEHGDPDHPVVIGALYNGKDAPPSDIPDPDNNVKTFLTRGGNQLKFVDKDGSEELIITQKDGKNKITLELGGPSIAIESEGDISIKGKTISLETTSGDITVKSGGALKQESSGDLQVKAGMNLKAEGSMNCEVKGGAQTKLEGGAMTEIKGALVKIN